MARLMKRVEKEQLFKGKYESFNEWVTSLAKRTNLSERTIWRRRKVGLYFDAFLRDKKTQGYAEQDIQKLEAVEFAADSVELISKIAGASTAIRDDLMEKLLDNKLNSAALRAAWKARRAEREEKNLPWARANSYQKPIDMLDDMTNTDSDSDSDSSTESVKITSLDISLALSSTCGWLREWMKWDECAKCVECTERGDESDECDEDDVRDSSVGTNRKKNFAKVKDSYHFLSELPVNTGTTHHRARLDALIVENISLPLFEKSAKICLHCMEFKVGISDLKNDIKLWEYEVFADFCWLCVPPKLIEAAEEKLKSHPKWGILVIEKEKAESTGAYAVSVYRPAKHFTDVESSPDSPDSSDEHSEAAHLWRERLQEYHAKRAETLMTVINRLANVPPTVPTARAQSPAVFPKV